MIYVILCPAFKSNEDEFEKLIKIGYTNDDKKGRRYYQYTSHNPTAKVLYEIPECGIDIENLLHSYFSKYRYSNFGKEWFYWNEEIIDFFKNHKTRDSILGSIESDLVIGCSKRRFNGFNEYVYKTIDKCLNYKMKVDSNYTMSLAMKDRDLCFSKVDSSNLIIESGVYKLIIDYFDIDLVDFENYVNLPIPENINVFLENFNTLPTFYDKMRAICESPFNNLERSIILEQVPITFKNFYNQLGPITLKACGYNITNIRKKIETDLVNGEKSNDIKELIYNSFLVGEKYLLSYIKAELSKLYQCIGYLSTPKASDLENYFEVKKVLLPNKETGKRDSAYEILKKKA